MAIDTSVTSGSYAAGYQDGMHFGARCASQRYLWIGIGIWCVLAAAIVLTALHFMGATK